MDFNDFRIRALEEYVKEYLPSFESRVVVLIIFLLLLIAINVGFFIIRRKYKKKAGDASAAKVTSVWYKKIGLWLWDKKYHILLVIFDILLLILMWVVFYMAFIIRPNVIGSTPDVNAYMVSGEQPIEIEFDLPIDQETVKFNMSPEVEGKWEWEGIWGSDSLKRKVKFTPKESIYPGSVVVIYITGIRLPWSDGKQHEQAVEFYGPKVPQIYQTIPDADSADVPVNKPLYVEYDSPLGSFVELKYEISPEVKFTVDLSGDYVHMLNLEEELKQDSEYTLKIYRNLRSYNVENGEDIERSDTETILDMKFKTVTTPYLKSQSPKGNAAPADSEIIAVFDQKMDKAEVENNFSIEPATEGRIEWRDDYTFVFIPNADLTKGQSYTVKFNKGLMSGSSGVTQEDIIFTFGVAGKVVVSSFSPTNGATGIEPAGLVISAQFNQPVDKESAQSHFSLSPSVAGTFSWEGDLMRYTLSTSAAYATRYTATVSAGVKTVYGIDSDQAFSTGFTTRANVFTISGIPYYRQQETFTCNIAATRMVLGYYGINMTENQIRSGVGTSDNPNVGWVSGYGVHIGPVSNFVSGYRQVETHTGWNTTDLLRNVQNGDPVILWWYNRYSQPRGAYTLPSGVTGYMGMHSEIVYGFAGTPENPTAIYVMDPWRGYLTYDPATFYSNWAYLNYTALVVR
ncbi:MAG: Ig-like domain-containing protein [Candidatus Dojkabacteria bacterium]|nr:MAG: Ig-like domain-containing protein [Candidatus Dojkabacteria bacterium]